MPLFAKVLIILGILFILLMMWCMCVSTKRRDEWYDSMELELKEQDKYLRDYYAKHPDRMKKHSRS